MPKVATTSVDIHPLLRERWSPRAFEPTHELDDRTLLALLEAARWSASSNNFQPWRFLVSRRGEAGFDAVFASLMPGNQLWAGQASALIVAVAEEVGEDGSARSNAAYDLGQAVAQLVVQAHAEGLHVHQMGGFRASELAAVAEVPSGFRPVVVLAVGALGDASGLPDELRDREHGPRSRRPLEEMAFTGSWGVPAVRNSA